MKNRRAVLFLTLSAVCGLLTAFAAPSFLQSSAPASEEKVPVVVAGDPALIGSEAQNAQPKLAHWPAETIPAGAWGASGTSTMLAVNRRSTRRLGAQSATNARITPSNKPTRNTAGFYQSIWEGKESYPAS